MKILVAGPGYTGSVLAGKLAAEGHEVVAASRSGRKIEGCQSAVADVGERSSVESLAGQMVTPDAIVHCASSSRGGEESYESVYLEGAKNLVGAFPGVPVFFTSSTSVYPQTDGSLVTEDSPADPDSPMADILRRAEDVILHGGGCVLRLSGIYGPGRSIHLKRLFAGEASIEPGEPSRFLNQIHRDDIVSAIRFLLLAAKSETAGEIFNVSDSQPLTMRECYEWLSQHFDLPLAPESEPVRQGKRAWTHKAVSNAKLCATGWVPAYPSFFDAVRSDPDLVASIRALS